LALWLSSQVAFHFEAARKRRPRNRPSHADGCAQVLWSKELIERKNLAHAEPSAEGSVWVESIESLKSKIANQLQKKTSANQKILVKPLGHTELSNYEVDIGDEPITELCKSERDCEVTSERKFALCIGASEISVNECVAVVDLYDCNRQGLMTG
jgi:hypothetical protein